jgi:hypothetical protein
VSEEISFETKPEIALEHRRWACKIGVACDVALMDGLAVELPPGEGSGRRRPPELMRREGSQKPAAMSVLQHAVAKSSWRKNS